MQRKLTGVAALALGAAVLAAGGVSANVDSAAANANPATLLSSARDGVTSVLELIGIEDEGAVAPGTLDDGEEFLPQASISLDQAVQIAQTAASGALGEVDLEHFNGKLVFNVDVGDRDVKVDATTGDVLAAVSDD